MNLRPTKAAAALAALCVLPLTAGPANADTIRIRSTSDTVDAGLVVGLLENAYKQAQPGDTILYTAEGTGKALTSGRNGLADVVITHAPSLEATFVADGFSFEPVGRQIFYSDYVIVGPADDPAGVQAGAQHDAITAFEKIAAAGAAGHATFVSRWDNSGTNVQENTMWALTNGVTLQQATQTGAATGAKEPGPSPGPAWYKRTNKTQGPNLLDANACTPTGDNPYGSCYTLVDRGTYNNYAAQGLIPNLKILAQLNDPAARGGENLLINPFSAYIVNPDKITTDPKPNVAAGTRFLDFLTSESFQKALESFPNAADPAFRPDAFPKITATVPTTATAGSAISIPLNATDRLPGAGVVAGIPLQLEQSTDNGSTWQAVGAPVTTDASGNATASATLSATSQLRVSWARYKKFSPSTSTLGLVTVPATPTQAPPVKDTTAPKATKLALTSTKVSLAVSEGSTVKIVVARQRVVKVKGKLRHRYTTVKRTSLKATKAGTVSAKLKTLRAATYRVTVTVTDAAGNTSTATKLVTIKAKKKAATH